MKDVNDKDNANDLQSSFANIDNDNVNQGTCLASHEQSSFADDIDYDNVNDNVNDEGYYVYLLDEKHQKGNPTSDISVNIPPQPIIPQYLIIVLNLLL